MKESAQQIADRVIKSGGQVPHNLPTQVRDQVSAIVKKSQNS